MEASLPKLTRIKLSAMKVISDVSEAALGTILQIWLGDAGAVTCIRAERTGPALGSDGQGVVLLEGKEQGVYLTLNQVGYCSAIDLTDLVDIVIIDPAPNRSISYTGTALGIYEITDKNGTRFFALGTRNHKDAAVTGYVTLTGESAGRIDRIPSAVYLGGATVLPRCKDDSLAVP